MLNVSRKTHISWDISHSFRYIVCSDKLDTTRVYNLLASSKTSEIEALLMSWPGLVGMFIANINYVLQQGETSRYSKECFKSIIEIFAKINYEQIGEVFKGAQLFLSAKQTSILEIISNDFFEAIQSVAAQDACSSIAIASHDDQQHEEDVESGTDTEINQDDGAVDHKAEGNTGGGHAANQRASFVASYQEYDSVDTDGLFYKDVKSDISNTNSSVSNLLSWIYSLPEWLQKYITNSHSVQQLLEAMSSEEKAMSLPNLNDLFAEQEANQNSDYLPIYQLENLKSNVNETDSDHIDASMIYDGDMSHFSTILPVEPIGSIFGNQNLGLNQELLDVM